MFSPEEIIIGSLSEGPAYAQYLSDVKDYFLARKMKKRLVATSVPRYLWSLSSISDSIRDTVFDVSMLFRPNDCFSWRPPDLDVLQYINSPVSINSETLEEFRLAARELLATYTRRPPTLLSEVVRDTTTACQEGLVWKVDHTDPSKDRQKSLLCQVPREKKKCRASCIETYSSRLAITWINATVMKIIKHDSRWSLKYEPDQLEKLMRKKLIKRRLRRWVPFNQLELYARTAYCRDFEKEGLTKPRIILRVLLEELHDRFPEEPSFANPGFFDKWILEVDGVDVEAERGHGLGMANELTTLMSFVIEAMVCKRTRIRTRWSGYVNDDAAAIFETWQEAKKFCDVDRDVCGELGLAYKEKASFLCCGSIVLCENYVSILCPNINRKLLFDKQAFAKLYGCANALHARESLKGAAYKNVTSGMFNALVNYWGPIYNRREFHNLTALGGWETRRLRGINVEYIDRCASTELDHLESRIFRVEKKAKIRFAAWRGETYKVKALHFFSEEYLKIKKVPLKMNNDLMFRPSMRPEEHTQGWNRFLRFLRKAVKQAKNCPLVVKDVYEYQCNQSPAEDIIPPIGLRKGVTRLPVRVTQVPAGSHPYWFGKNSEEYDLFAGYPAKRLEYSLELGSGEHYIPQLLTAKEKERLSQRYVRESQIDKLRRIEDYDMINLPSPEAMEAWNNPLLVQKVSEFYGCWYGCFVPTIDLLTKKEFLNKRWNVYQRKLTAEEWIFIGARSPEVRRFLFGSPRKEEIFQDLGRLARMDEISSELAFIKWRYGPTSIDVEDLRRRYVDRKLTERLRSEYMKSFWGPDFKRSDFVEDFPSTEPLTMTETHYEYQDQATTSATSQEEEDIEALFLPEEEDDLFEEDSELEDCSF
jgi:hypothetical protein